MNKYIKSDIENGISYLKAGIINALRNVYYGEETEIYLGKFIPISLILECCKFFGLDAKLSKEDAFYKIEDKEHGIVFIHGLLTGETNIYKT